jgi:hypothetical protein
MNNVAEFSGMSNFQPSRVSLFRKNENLWQVEQEKTPDRSQGLSLEVVVQVFDYLTVLVSNPVALAPTNVGILYLRKSVNVCV